MPKKVLDRIDEQSIACKPPPIWPRSKLWSGHWETIHKEYPAAIVDGELMEHVGIGWIPIRTATDADYLVYPEVRNPDAAD